jgi:hypothetical protein
LAQNTRLRLISASYRVNRENGEGDTALHLAARLADPYFYQTLSSIGDVYAFDKNKRSALSIFNNRQQQVTRHAQ